MPGRLVDKRPLLEPDDLLAGLVPPPLFAHVGFETYRPDPAEPTQAAALAELRAFADRLAGPSARARRFGRPALLSQRQGVYLDGGFGVGKTHLLASLWHAAPTPKAYATFVEVTHLVGALGFAAVVESLGRMQLLAIDEFELDDPGDTVLVSTLLSRLSERGVALVATSNTLPDRLGEQRFAAEDFAREIQGLAARFTTVRIDGPDYRHRGLPQAPTPWDADEVTRHAELQPDSTLDDFDGLMAHLAALHPSRYGAMLRGVGAVHLNGVRALSDEAAALRLVVLVDRLYDGQHPVLASGTSLDAIFSEAMLAGGYRKKYRRAISRLVALARLAEPSVMER